MNRRGSFLKGALVGALVMLLLVGLAGGGAIYLKNKLIGESVVNKESSAKLDVVKALIKQNYLYSDEIDDETLEAGLVSGYVNSLGDPYSVYYDEEATQQLLESTTGEFSGIGVAISQDIKTMLITFVTVYPDSPADKAGLKDGDILYKVDGEDVSMQDINEVVTKLRGMVGTKVEVTVIRGEEAEEYTTEVTRDIIEVQTVSSEIKENDIGYISITEFNATTDEHFEKALIDLNGRGIKGLVIDLRNNPGGTLDTVCNIADVLLPEGTIVYTKDKNGNQDTYTSDASHQLAVPLVVLINGNSASASEILAGAVKDYGVGTLVGTTTYGKGIVQQLFPLVDGTCLKLTISEYFTPKGNNIHGIGVTPDVEVEYTAEDNQLQEAYKILQNGM